MKDATKQGIITIADTVLRLFIGALPIIVGIVYVASGLRSSNRDVSLSNVDSFTDRDGTTYKRVPAEWWDDPVNAPTNVWYTVVDD